MQYKQKHFSCNMISITYDIIVFLYLKSYTNETRVPANLSSNSKFRFGGNYPQLANFATPISTNAVALDKLWTLTRTWRLYNFSFWSRTRFWGESSDAGVTRSDISIIDTIHWHGTCNRSLVCGSFDIDELICNCFNLET